MDEKINNDAINKYAFVQKYPIWKSIFARSTIITPSYINQCKLVFNIEELAEEIILCSSQSYPNVARHLSLVKFKLFDIGCKSDISTREVYNRVHNSCFSLCPVEAALELRRLYLDQPYGNWIVVLINPVLNKSGRPLVLRIGHGVNGLWLDTQSAVDTKLWSPNTIITVVKRVEILS